jgi:hypothetical protein
VRECERGLKSRWRTAAPLDSRENLLTIVAATPNDTPRLMSGYRLDKRLVNQPASAMKPIRKIILAVLVLMAFGFAIMRLSAPQSFRASVGLVGYTNSPTTGLKGDAHGVSRHKFCRLKDGIGDATLPGLLCPR